MMASGSFEGVFVLLAAALVGVASVQVALLFGAWRAVRWTERVLRAAGVEAPPPRALSAKPP